MQPLDQMLWSISSKIWNIKGAIHNRENSSKNDDLERPLTEAQLEEIFQNRVIKNAILI